MASKTVQVTGVFHKTTLDNGIRVVTSAMPTAHSVGIGVFVVAGSRYESSEHAGISHFVEHLAFKGTERRPTPNEISGTVEGFGGELNAGTEQELTVYWCKVARPHLSECLDLLIDMLRNSVYDLAELERERGVILEEQSMINDYPHEKADLMLDELLWPDHPLGRDISGTRESISSITREAVLEYVSRFYTPGNMVVSVAGDVEHDDVAAQVEALCHGWNTHEPPGWAPFTHVQEAPQFRQEYRKTGQTNVAIGLPGLSVTDPDRYALDMLSVVLGEGMSSRLFLEIREKQGLAYDVHSGVAHFLDSGAFFVSAGVEPRRAYDVVRAVLYEVERLRNGVPEEEMERAKRLATGRLLLRLEGTQPVAGWIGSQEALLGRISDVDRVIEAINAVSTDDVGKVANELLCTEKLNMAVVGPHRGRSRFERLLEL